MSTRICIVSEAICAPFDEGVKIFVYNLIKQLSKEHVVLALSRSNHYDQYIASYCKRRIPANKLFLSYALRKEIKSFKPDIIYYIPIACATLNSFLRARVLKFYGNGTTTIMITLQPRQYTALSKRFIPLVAPDLVLAQSDKTQQVLSDLGCTVSLIPGGVDVDKFVPVSQSAKTDLRKKYGFPINKYMILHVGHLNRNRNVQIMETVQAMDNTQGVLVGSTSTIQDSDLAKQLKKKGVMLITEHVEHIEEIYQCADCYLFPVLSETGCIEIPLSILEAMACNLPVVATKFGGLPDLLSEQDAIIYLDTIAETIDKLAIIKTISEPGTRSIALQHSWEALTQKILIASKVQ